MKGIILIFLVLAIVSAEYNVHFYPDTTRVVPCTQANTTSDRWLLCSVSHETISSDTLDIVKAMYSDMFQFRNTAEVCATPIPTLEFHYWPKYAYSDPQRGWYCAVYITNTTTRAITVYEQTPNQTLDFVQYYYGGVPPAIQIEITYTIDARIK